MVNKLHLQCKLLLSACFLLAAFPALAADIVTRTDRTQIGVNESFTLTFDAHGAVNGEPDFTPLEELFEIVNTTQSSSINIINGQTSRKQTWTLTLFPKRSGTVTIPAISFGSDWSPELQIEVAGQKNQAAGAGEDIFLQVEAAPQDPYVQEQVVYTIRLYRAVNTASASLSDPELSSGDAVIKQLGNDSTYETNQAGRRYAVYERRYMIFPQTPGKLTIHPVRFDGVIQNHNRGFFDPFGGGGGKRVRLMSDTIELQVKPVPPSFNGAYWLPAKELRVSETWSPEPPVFKVGEAVTRNLALSAAGLTAAQLPEFTPQIPQNFKQYPDQPTLEDKRQGENVLGIRLDKLALIPTHPGRYTLPAIEIPWWNTRTNKQEIARLPAREIEVLPGSAGVRVPNGTAAAPSFNDNLEQQAPQNIENTSGAAPPAVDESAGLWPWLSLMLALGWTATGIGWWLSLAKNRRVSGNNREPKIRIDRKAGIDRLKMACASNDAESAKSALLDWARAALPEKAGLSLGTMANHVDADFGREIMKLNEFLYRRQPEQTWSGDELWQAFQNADHPETRQTKPGAEVLEPLYKIKSG